MNLIYVDYYRKLLVKKINITKNRTRWKSWQMLQSNLYNVQRIGRRKRRVILSGKKKAHTVKTEILMEKVSKSYAGSTHDFRIKKQEKFLPKNSIKYADSGYQGWQELQSKLVIPYKRYRKKPLTPEQ